MKTYDVNEVAEAIGIPTSEWAGNCYAIACALVKANVVQGTAVYGHWTGAIHRNSYFRDRRHLPFCPHGWVLTDDGYVVDPTRWTFEAKAPYIYVGIDEGAWLTPCLHCDHIGDEHGTGFFKPCMVEGCSCEDYEREPWPYDEGGDHWRREMQRPAPAPTGARAHELPLTGPALIHVRRLLQDTQSAIAFTRDQVHWLANVPYAVLQPHAYDIYTALEAANLGALVPLDNRRRAEREARKDA
jgi:hypothetical protein